MDKRRLHMSVLAGILVLALVIGLAAGFMPMQAEAATSGELKAQLDALEKEKDISKDILIEAIESALVSAYKKRETKVSRILFACKCAGQPNVTHVQGDVKTCFFRLLYNTVPALDCGVGKLKLNGDTGSNICIANLFGFHDLEHNNMRIGHGAVVDQIVLTHQRVTFVSQDLIFCHVVPP